MGRAPCCDKANVKRGPWSPQEDQKLKSHIEKHGTGGNWIALPPKIGLKRCGKSCRLRWLNYLRPNIKHGGFTEDEDNLICSLYVSIGSRWSIIASQLPGRTDNDIKNYWNTRLKKKLFGMQFQRHTKETRSFPNNRDDAIIEHDHYISYSVPPPTTEPVFSFYDNLGITNDAQNFHGSGGGVWDVRWARQNQVMMPGMDIPAMLSQESAGSEFHGSIGALAPSEYVRMDGQDCLVDRWGDIGCLIPKEKHDY